MASNKKGITGENLLQILESRLDNVVYRVGYGVSRAEARQMVNHGQFEVNGKKVNIPSYLVKPGDVIAIKETSVPKFKENVEANSTRIVPDWLDADKNTLSGRVVALPTREHIDYEVEEHMIVELYSK